MQYIVPDNTGSERVSQTSAASQMRILDHETELLGCRLLPEIDRPAMSRVQMHSSANARSHRLHITGGTAVRPNDLGSTFTSLDNEIDDRQISVVRKTFRSGQRSEWMG